MIFHPGSPNLSLFLRVSPFCCSRGWHHPHFSTSPQTISFTLHPLLWVGNRFCSTWIPRICVICTFHRFEYTSLLCMFIQKKKKKKLLCVKSVLNWVSLVFKWQNLRWKTQIGWWGRDSDWWFPVNEKDLEDFYSTHCILELCGLHATSPHQIKHVQSKKSLHFKACDSFACQLGDAEPLVRVSCQRHSERIRKNHNCKIQLSFQNKFFFNTNFKPIVS